MKKLIICDWNRTLYNPRSNSLYTDSINFLEQFKNENLILISQNEINTKLDKKKLKKYFKKILIGKKNNLQFKQTNIQFPSEKKWVIGDKIDSEIYFGNLLDYQTIRILRGKFKNEKAKNNKEIPTYTVNNLKKISGIILSK